MLNVAVVGLGPIGYGCALAARCEADMLLVGLCDADPGKVGKSLDDLFDDHSGQNGIVVTDDLESVAKAADVAIVSTTSCFPDVAKTVRQLMAHGVHVVSSCEEMTWPWYRHAALADQLDAAARDANCTLVGAGVNPGFVMDSLAVTLSSMVRRVRKVRCVRRVDAFSRREPLQRKIGATMTPEKFRQLAGEGKLGHRGLAESVALLAAGLGRKVGPGEVSETLEPVIAEQHVDSAIGPIEPGFVQGMHNTAAWAGDGLLIELDLTMAVGQEDPADKVRIEGPVSFTMKIPGSIPGDSATIAALLNVARLMPDAKRGLISMLDLPPAGCRGADGS